jgi:antitoxin (DNA-binding transcriptional repressor) of toxin-antitoxin stability system
MSGVVISVKQNMFHMMKTATVRDLRLHFPVVEGWLAEGEEVAITKSGRRIAVLTRAAPEPARTLQSTFEKRFGGRAAKPRRATRVTETLIEDRGA